VRKNQISENAWDALERGNDTHQRVAASKLTIRKRPPLRLACVAFFVASLWSQFTVDFNSIQTCICVDLVCQGSTNSKIIHSSPFDRPVRFDCEFLDLGSTFTNPKMKILNIVAASTPNFPARVLIIWCHNVDSIHQRYDGLKKRTFRAIIQCQETTLEAGMGFDLLNGANVDASQKLVARLQSSTQDFMSTNDPLHSVAIEKL